MEELVALLVEACRLRLLARVAPKIVNMRTAVARGYARAWARLAVWEMLDSGRFDRLSTEEEEQAARQAIAALAAAVIDALPCEERARPVNAA